MKILLAAAALCAIGLAACGAGAQPPPFVASEPIVIASTDDMRGDGLVFPDTPMGVLPPTAGQYVVFAAGGSSRDVGPGAGVVPYGTYKFSGTLDRLAPARSGGQWPAPALTKGSVQPSPDGSDFDRDYGAGGPTYAVGSQLLQVYHGEYHCAPPVGIPGYGGAGMAISKDGGRSFRKIGQILSPHAGRDDFCSSGRKGGLWIDGAMIEADADGNPAPGGGDYDYILFVDHNAIDEPFIAVSIARAKKADVLAAVQAGKAPAFMKYYNPGAAAGPVGQYFTEPGVGGRSTPVVIGPHDHIGTPMVAYDSYTKTFVLSYQNNQKAVVLRSGATLFSWSAPVSIFTLGPASDVRLFYPTPVGVGADPTVLGKQFYVYFQERGAQNADPQLMRTSVESP